ncbi:MAG TPA: FkbM family methyltransferase [Gammaproteobacteria bacterium]|nr:FkbM family methyltransferase [Gammaproteobacteria bacterium]
MSRDYRTVDYHPGRIKRLLRKLFWFLVVYLPARRPVTVLTRNGKLTFDSKDKTTGRILHVYRNHEFDEMMLVVQFLRDKGLLAEHADGTVIDVGGYLGMSSSAFLLENVFEKAVAFEPSPDNYRLLEINISNNQLQNRLRAFNMALSDENSELLFELSGKNFGDHRIRHAEGVTGGHYGEDKRNVIRVPASRFDDFLVRNPDIDQDAIRLVWMDIQGHEARFLSGAHNFLSQHPDVPVMMEFWPYAIKRSGIDKDEFSELVSGTFNKFYALEESNFYEHDITSIGDYFDKHDDPDGGSAIMLTNIEMNYEQKR